eukprot:TRINITY_DN11728_c0_g2_i1.p1 TRINITY_DN11728_c0_g2~~TRINITY_DN11728_c0_g2_i1.p1  ORF type:complete len:309 (+),score=70.08 TRINITY_DN11728_c0_g2_i1:76-1002(+)
MKQALLPIAFCLVVVDAVSLTLTRRNHSQTEGSEHVVRGQNVSKAKTAFLQEEQVPTIRHQKEAGDGYVEGSPLYNRQERLKAGPVETVETREISAPEAPAVQAPQITSGDGAGGSMTVPDQVPEIKSPVSPQHGLAGTIVYLIFIFIVAYFYRAYGFNCLGLTGGHGEVRTEVAPFQGDGFTHGFCDLCRCTRDDNCIMFWACCCPGIRWSDTVSNIKVRFLKFWVALAVFLFVSLLAGGVAGPWVAGIFGFVVLGLGVYYRQQLRGALGHSKGTLKTITLDILAWSCCPCCAIVQEAKEVEYVFVK